jgi:hypothetical protein
MRVAEYRDMVSEVSNLFASLRSAATPGERIAEARRLEIAVCVLARAECPRAKFADLAKSARVRDAVAKYLEESGLRVELDRRRDADALYSQMAFAGDWK